MTGVMTAAMAMTSADFGVQLLVRSTVLSAVLLALALIFGALLFRSRPGARHLALLLSLAAAVLAPAWLVIGGELGPAARSAQAVGDDLLSFTGQVARPADESPASAGQKPAPARQRWLTAAFPQGVLIIWAVGVLLALVRLARGLWLARGIRRRARPLSEGVWLSTDVPHAAVVGLWRPRVLVHPSLLQRSPASVAQVLDHEQAHARRRDPLWGAVERALAAFAWFHPLVIFLRRELATAREEACDRVVVDRHPAAEYARTLLSLATAAPGRRHAHLVGVLPAGPALEPRIRRLLASDGSPRAGRLVRLGGPLFWLVLMASTLPLTRALAVALPEQATEPSPSTVVWGERPLDGQERALVARAGEGVEAAFVLRALDGGGSPREVVLGPELSRERVTPASTFKMIIALAALEKGVATGADFSLKFPGVRESIPGANQDHTLASAMRTSATWYFTELLHRLPADWVRGLLADAGYGNASVQGDPLRYWISGELAISAREQVDTLARLHEGRLPFGERSREVLSRITLLEEHGGVRLHGKTGTATGSPWGTVSWLVGHVEGGGGRFVYALLLRPGRGWRGSESQDPSAGMRAARQEILRGLLRRFGVLPAGGAR